jgi:uncharacterized protein YndB with AHSA1/START domain
MQDVANEYQVVLTKVFPVDRPILFSAFTQPQKMEKWFFLEKNWETEIRNTVETGGRYTIKMRNEDGMESNHSGIYKEIDPPKRLVFTWDTNKSIKTLVSIDFKELSDGTEITLTHEKLPNESFFYLHLWSWQRFFDNLRHYFDNLVANHHHQSHHQPVGIV